MDRREVPKKSLWIVVAGSPSVYLWQIESRDVSRLIVYFVLSKIRNFQKIIIYFVNTWCSSKKREKSKKLQKVFVKCGWQKWSSKLGVWKQRLTILAYILCPAWSIFTLVGIFLVLCIIWLTYLVKLVQVYDVRWWRSQFDDVHRFEVWRSSPNRSYCVSCDVKE